MSQNRLEELLKKKGIGPEGSKTLKIDELNEIEYLFQDDTLSLTTKATILTALLMLPPSEIESTWLMNFKNKYTKILPRELFVFIETEIATSLFEKYLIQTIKHIHLSYTEASEAMELLLCDDSIPEFQKGAFLEAQRLKRESFEENKAFFDVLWKHTDRIESTLPILFDISDNYDGFNRYHNFAPFFAAAIASCGYPCIIHSIDSVAPKFGITSHKIIRACNGKADKSIEATLKHVSNPKIAWGYIDQSIFHPLLYKLKTIRKEMVKRPFLATFEKMMQPIQAIHGNHLLTGYTHAHYRKEVAEQLQSQNKVAAALVIKGIEGSSCPPLNRETIKVTVTKEGISDETIHASEFIDTVVNQLPSKNIEIQESVKLGLDALDGVENEAYHQIVYYTIMAISGFGFESKESVSKKIKSHLKNGIVLEHFKCGLV
ncbi:hypothetical protein [uncultured Cytophaga sp.]|uniref:hypothetical protein n=1 Tax=uncultured Cytophaga sp. TaxID=160238 RepID=UPI0026278015|nr:hypothetical protein [uncultured Cytophaga sp.]